MSFLSPPPLKIASYGKWKTNTVYPKGAVVTYQGLYYMSSKAVPASSTFNYAVWVPVGAEPNTF